MATGSWLASCRGAETGESGDGQAQPSAAHVHRTGGPPLTPRTWQPDDLSPGRHLCGRIRSLYTLSVQQLRERKRSSLPRRNAKIIILGGGPNRIGQGIEFDYCCCHASFALQELGYETIMVNCNPETVSTDYDTSDRLYFEPLTLEDVLNIVERETQGCQPNRIALTLIARHSPLRRRHRPIWWADAAQPGGSLASDRCPDPGHSA